MNLVKSRKSKRTSLLYILAIILVGFFGGPSPALAAEMPEFIKIKDWKLQRFGTSKMVLTCKAVFYNPNKAKAKILGIDLNVFFGDTRAGKVNQIEKKVKIKKNQAFEIPLRIVIDPETSTWGYVSGFLSAVSMQDFVVNIRGYLQLRILGVKLKIPLDESEDLNLKRLLSD